MITKKNLLNEIENCKNLLSKIYGEMDIAKENENEEDYIYFSKCKKSKKTI